MAVPGPGSKTPHATLYPAILWEINMKAAEARFVKTDRGHFTLKDAAKKSTKKGKAQALQNAVRCPS